MKAYIYIERAQGLKKGRNHPPPPFGMVENRRERRAKNMYVFAGAERASQVLACFFSAMKSALKHVACNYVLFTCVYVCAERVVPSSFLLWIIMLRAINFYSF
jgi:hypothetical protein